MNRLLPMDMIQKTKISVGKFEIFKIFQQLLCCSGCKLKKWLLIPQSDKRCR